jgi:hypothetical protein
MTPEENQQKQREATKARKAEEKRLKEAKERQAAEAERLRTERNAKEREEQEERARINAAAKLQREAEDAQRRREINDAADAAVRDNRLNREKATQIAEAECARPVATAETARVKLEQALTAQKSPPLDRWRFKLGMNQAVNVYDMIRRDNAGDLFQTFGGFGVHISVDRNCVRDPGSIEGRNADQLVHSLLTVQRDYRIHATLETGAQAQPHYYYGDIIGGDNQAEKQHLKGILDDYIATVIRPRVQDAIDRVGDI